MKAKVIGAMVAVLLAAGAAQAADKYWNSTDSYWHIGASWSPTGVPNSADYVYVNPVSGTDTLLEIDNITGNAYANVVYVDSTTSNTVTLQQTGGDLAVGNEVIGYLGSGAFTQSGGTTISSYLYLGYETSSLGTYNLSDTGSLTAGQEYIGLYGTGAFTQSGGTHTVNELYLGSGNSGSGTYNLNGGTLNVGGNIVDGDGYSTFNLDGGTFNFTGSSITLDEFKIGSAWGSNGSFTLASGKTLTTGLEVIGYEGAGTFTQSGGMHTISTYLSLGTYSGGNGSYNLSGTGSLLAAYEYIGLYGTGAFTQSGGTHTVTNDVYLGYDSSGSGTYNLNGGTLNVGGNIVDVDGYGTFNLDGGALNVTGSSIALDEFNIGSAPGSNGSFTLASGKTLTMGLEHIGREGAGAFTQTDGTNTVIFGLYLGVASGSNGTYNLSDTGSLSAAYEYIGLYGTGAFTQSGGTHTVTNDVCLGFGSSGSGTYNLNGGTLNIGCTIMDGDGYSTFNLDGGTLTVAGSSITLDEFKIGSAWGSNGSFTLASGKTLTTGLELIGYEGTGALTQTGGTHTISGNFFLGTYSGGNGSYNLSGAGSLSVGGAELIGMYGAGTFTQSGGTHTISTYLSLGTYSGGNGSYNLTGTGSLSAADEIIGDEGAGAFIQSGGTNTVGTLTINNGSYTLSGGTLTVDASMDNGGVFDLAGATLTGSGALANNGLFSGFGTIAGSGGFINNGLLTQSGGNLTLANTGTNTNYGNMDLAGGYQLKLDGATLNNSGTVNLNGALVTGAGTLANEIGGNIVGRGSITSNFSNAGNLAVSGGTLNISKPFTNSGAIQLTGAGSTLAGGAIANTGTLQGSGNVANSLTNTGVIDAVNGILSLSGPVTNAAAGTMRTSTGSKILVANGMNANAGLISLAGGTFDTNGTALTNSGRIAGYGVFATGGLSNTGNMTLSGGTATVNGNVTNQIGARIEVAQTPAVFTGDVVNNGIFKTTNTTVTFAGSYTENGAYISDPSTNHFTNLHIGATGYLVGGAGDEWRISGTLKNNSQQNTLWNTNDASLFLSGSGPRDLYLAGSDLGALNSGYINNFAWGEFSLGSGVSVNILDGNAASGAALYVGLFELDGGLTQLGNIFSDYNIYYNPQLAGNAYLNDQTFSLNGEGFLMPASPGPVPGDANEDGVVDAADYIALKRNFGMTGGATWAQGNFNGGVGTVDWVDLQILMSNFGTRSVDGAPPAPEPATLSLLALGGLAMLRRRRK